MKRQEGEIREVVYHGVTVDYGQQVVRVHSDEALRVFLDGPGRRSVMLARHMRKRYRALTGVRLNIAMHSLAIEVLGHVYMERLAKVLRRRMDRIPETLHEAVCLLTERVLQSTEVIDCGEAQIDSNRIVWDALVPLRRWIYRRADGD